jgi:hypothetical protein
LNYGRGNAPGYTHAKLQKPVFPSVPKPRFIPNETVMIAESPSMLYGLSGANWPEPIRPIQTEAVRVPRPTFPHYDLGELSEVSTGFSIGMALAGVFLGMMIGVTLGERECDAGWARYEKGRVYNKSRRR